MRAQGRRRCRGSVFGSVLLGLAVLLCPPVVALAAAPPGVDEVRFRSLGVDDGLSQATVRAIVQDDDGFIWIGTQDGLNRFDGFRFEVFRHDPTDPTSLSDNHVVGLAVDAEQALWIATQSGGLNRLDPDTGRFERFRRGEAHGLVSDVLVDVRVDRSGQLWIQAEHGQIQWLERDPIRFRSVPDDPGLRLLGFDPDGALILARGANLLTWSGNDDPPQPLAQLHPETTRATHALHDEESIWVGSENHGLYQLDLNGELLRHWRRDSREPARGLLDDQIRSLMHDRYGQIWVGTVSGLSLIDTHRASILSWAYAPGDALGLAGARIVSLLEDRSGLIWAGSWTGGASVFDPETRPFTLVRHRPDRPGSLPGNAVSAVLENPDGSVWVSLLDAGGIARFDLELGLLEHHQAEPDEPGRLPYRMVGSLLHDEQGGLLVGTLGAGLVRLDPDTGRFDRLTGDPTLDLPDNATIERLQRDSQGSLWAATIGHGLYRRCAGCAGFEQFMPDPNDPASLSGDEINGVLEASDGSFWVATRRQGLNRMDRAAGRFEHFTSANSGLRHNSITGMYQARGGRIWIGTQGGGLHRMDRNGPVPEFTAIGRPEGLNADAIGEIAEDPDGRIWVSTTAGLSRIHPESLEVENFPFIDGRSGAGFFIGSIDRTAPDRAWFGGVRGLVRVDFTQVASSPPATDVALTRLLLFNQPVRPGDHPALGARLARKPELTLSHDLSLVTIEFVAPGNLRHAADLRYAYRLDGLDRDWIETGPDRAFATYTVLPAGDYRLQVRAGTRSGSWGEPRELPIQVLAPAWRQPQALLAYLVAAVVLLSILAWRIHLGLSRRRRAQDEIAASRQRLRMALWGSRDELWEADIASNSLVRENRIDRSAPDDDTAYMSLDAFWASVHPDDLDGLKRAYIAHVKGNSAFFEAEFRVRKDEGPWHWMLSRGRITVYDAEGQALRLSGTTRDISAIKETELALLKLNEELESRVQKRTRELQASNQTLTEALDELKDAQRYLVQTEKLAALGGLVAGIAHEINTPLGVGVTAASHLESETRRMHQRLADQEPVSPEQLKRYSDLIHQGCQLILRNLRRADQLVRSFKQVAVDQSSEQRRSFDLAIYMDEILTSLHPEIKRRRHQVTTDIPPDLMFDSYPGALYQVMVNLVMNGLIHGFDEDQQGQIRIEAEDLGDTVLIRYRDNGRGMDKETAERMFDPFFTTRRGQGGSGLGLHIVYNLVTQVLDGSIDYQTGPGQGLHFDIRLPRVAGAR
jgi:ligand-binding sensor domain-containing protein/signal transduction histidine kinase